MRYNVVSAGEALIDLVSANYASDLGEASGFVPHVGGSPANLASNLRCLGLDVGLICAVGEDAFGRRIADDFERRGLPVDLVHRAAGQPTTLVTVTKSKGSPDFEVYRGANAHLDWSSFALALERGADLFHTTCFALSALPARSHLLRAAAAFAKTGSRLSIDANYAEKVWPDRGRAQRVVAEYVRLGAIVKMSEVDYERLYQRPLVLSEAEAAAQPLLHAGAKLVCFTFGGDGAVALQPGGHVDTYVPPPLDIVDATGAGDAFWAGFVAAHLDGRDAANCLRVGSAVAAKKLQQQGPLREQVAWRGW